MNTFSADIIAVIEASLCSNIEGLKARLTKIGAIIAVQDGIVYPELGLNIIGNHSI